MRIQQVSDAVHMVTGTNVNWALVTDGDAVTVVDAGYPNDGDDLLQSLQLIGRRPEDVQAILVTHAHLDHIGGIPTLLSKKSVPVITGPAEVAHAHRDYLEQISPLQMIQQCYHPSGIKWVAQTLRAVLPHASMKIPQAQPAPYGEKLDIPGALIPVATPGHTTGHTAYFMKSDGVVFSGDALVTDHPLLTGPTRPQFLPDFFNENRDAMRTSLRTLGSLDADTLVPGHGSVERLPIREIAAAVEEGLDDSRQR